MKVFLEYGIIKFMKNLKYLVLIIFIYSCASGSPMFVVDPNSVEDEKKVVIDREECFEVASNIDMGDEVAGKAVGGALLGSAGVAGVAALAYGAVFAPAIPFILAGGAAGGTLWGKSASDKEKKFRNNIMQQCMEKRGYVIYSSE
tara:strand:- start:355 stop:789 length:435 start_codon:yes stop_codon:yes gene_type:complete